MVLLDKLDRYFHKPGYKDLYSVFLALELLTKANQPLQQSLAEVGHQQKNKYLAGALLNISHRLMAGMSVGPAFRKEDVFPPIVAASLEAGEKSGSLSSAFHSLADIMYIQNNLYKKVKNALFTPKLAGCMMTIMVIAFVKFAIPEYVKLFKENNIEPPKLMSFATFIVSLIVDRFYITIPILILIWLAVKSFLASHVFIVDRLKFKIPIYKGLHFVFLQHEFCSIIRIMMINGVPLQNALGQAARGASNQYMASKINSIRSSVLLGNGLASSMIKENKSKVFDPMLISSIRAGEKSDMITEVLDKCCDYYASALRDLIEPTSVKVTFVVMIPLGALVVSLFLMTILPMFDFMNKLTAAY